MALFDIKEVKDAARAEINKERNEKAKSALIRKLRELDAAEQIVVNIKRQIADLEASIEDGSFI